MGIEEAGSCLNNTDSLIVSLDLVDIARLARHNRDQVETELLGVQVGREGEWQALLLARWNLHIITSRRDIADNSSAGMGIEWQWLQSGQRAPNDRYLDRLCLIIGEIQQSLCRVSIDKLDAEDLCVGERGGDRDGEIGG